jgi:hypothetical protein
MIDNNIYNIYSENDHSYNKTYEILVYCNNNYNNYYIQNYVNYNIFIIIIFGFILSTGIAICNLILKQKLKNKL